MKAKIVYIALALVLVFSLAAVAVPAGPAMASPGTIQVDVNDGACVSGTGQGDPYSVVYCSIQDAIDDAVGGDTINVAAGTYAEQVVINKSLTLVGAGAGTTTIKAPASRTGTVAEGLVTWDYIVAAYPSSGTIDVRIEGFTIDANGENAMNTDTQCFAGVFFRDVDGANAGLYSCTVNNFGSYNGGWSGTYGTWMGNSGVKIYGASDLTVDDNQISDYTVNGVTASGSSSDVTITDNTVTGSATTQAGVQLRDGTGDISGNTISGHTNSIGIYLYDAAVGVTVDGGNTFSNNNIGLFLEGTSGATIDGNTFTNNLLRSIVIQQDSDNNVVTDNTITMVSGNVDAGIVIGSDSGGNVIGGDTSVAGNSITLPTDGSGVRYCVWLSAADTGDVTIKNNTINGGQRAVQFDGGPGHSGTNTVSDNTISGSVFGGIMSSCFGDFVIFGNTISGTDRPMEFLQVNHGDISITGNTITSSAYDGINAGSYNSMTLSGNSFVGMDGILGVNNRDAGKTVDAENNWWGDASGPSGFGPGHDSAGVSANVDYIPWLGKQLCALKTAIAALVSDDFNNTKAWVGQKQALLNKIDAVGDQFGDGSYRGALNKLQRDVTKRIAKWIDPDSQGVLFGYVDDEIDILSCFVQ